MKMSSADCKAYPKTAYYVRVNLREVLTMPSVVSALNTIGQINQRRLRIALTWGQGPTVKVADLIDAYGEFTPYSKSHELRIDRKKVIAPFEKGEGLAPTAKGGRFYILGATILHELVHWGDDQDGKDRAGEEGEEFERSLFGAVLYPCKSCSGKKKAGKGK